jgi:hypothetical protein
MNLYIETENGKPKNHPAFEDNLLQAFNTIPENWVAFERVQCPEIGVYEVLESEQPEYQLVDGVYKDVWMVRTMTNEEIEIKKAEAVAAWDNHFPSWLFNNDKCAFEAPIPYPQDGKHYYWDEPTVSWKVFTPVVQLA